MKNRKLGVLNVSNAEEMKALGQFLIEYGKYMKKEMPWKCLDVSVYERKGQFMISDSSIKQDD